MKRDSKQSSHKGLKAVATGIVIFMIVYILVPQVNETYVDIKHAIYDAWTENAE